jgi:hypothetical protein
MNVGTWCVWRSATDSRFRNRCPRSGLLSHGDPSHRLHEPAPLSPSRIRMFIAVTDPSALSEPPVNARPRPVLRACNQAAFDRIEMHVSDVLGKAPLAADVVVKPSSLEPESRQSIGPDQSMKNGCVQLSPSSNDTRCNGLFQALECFFECRVIGARREHVNMFGHEDPAVEAESVLRSSPRHRAHEDICNPRVGQQLQPVLTGERDEPDPTWNLTPLHSLSMVVFRTHYTP